MLFYQGRLHDKIRNELLLVREGEHIFRRIQSSPCIKVCESGATGSRLLRVLDMLGFDAEMLNPDTRNEDEKGIVLVSGVFDEDLEKKLHSCGWEEIYFMDLMDKYIAVAWCHCNPNGMTAVQSIL